MKNEKIIKKDAFNRIFLSISYYFLSLEKYLSTSAGLIFSSLDIGSLRKLLISLMFPSLRVSDNPCTMIGLRH
jgi:hypothetical protein